MTSSTTIKFPESTSKYGQGDTVEIHRQTETQIIRLCHVTQSPDVCWRLKSGLRRFSTVLHLIPVAFICLQRLIQFFGKILWNIFCVLQSEFNWLQLCQFALPTMPPLGLPWMISSLTSGRKLKRNTERNVLPHRHFVAHHVFMNVFSIPRGQQAILHDGKIPRVQCG